MIDFPIIDTHLHVWDPARLRYPWLASVPMLNRRYDLADYKQACGSVPVEKMVFVQCEVDPAQYRDEVAWVASLARQDPRLAGIVAWAPLESGQAAEPGLAELVKNPLVKGVRRIIQFEPDVGFCLRPDFIKGVQLLSRFGLSFDLCIKGVEQTANTIQLVRSCPDVKFIVDHIGKPFIKDRAFEPWRAHLRELASMPHVWCKVSGLVVEADMQHWTREDLKPYVDHVLEVFGFERVMFGGDWPVVLQAATLPQWVEVLDSATSGCTQAQRRQLFHDNAVSFYRLS
jgi:L-fuconolactonase